MSTFLRLSTVLFLTFLLLNTQAQKRSVEGAIVEEIKGFNFIGLNEGCDSIGWPIPSGQTVRLYRVGAGGVGGYTMGTNQYGDIAKGNYYDLSASTANFVNRFIVGFGPINGANGANGTKPVTMEVLDGTSGTPGSSLGNFSSTLDAIKVLRDNFSVLTFSPAIPLPASKKIFLVVRFPDLTWNTTADAASKDTLALYSTLDGEVAQPISWEQWGDNSWHFIPEAWAGGDPVVPFNVNTHIYPLVSTTAGGCTLPVTFGNFEGKTQGGAIDLVWNTWTETNNDRFEVERSDDAFKFISIGTVASKAANGLCEGFKGYGFKDLQPVNGFNYYRIRQVDRDGTSSFSKTVRVAFKSGPGAQIVQSFYPNPTKDRLVIQMAPGIRSVQSLRFSDPSGKVMSTLTPPVAADGTINVSSINLRAGLNFATITLQDGQQQNLKVIKQ